VQPWAWKRRRFEILRFARNDTAPTVILNGVQDLVPKSIDETG
jgi:hypothetical protein